jgi:hypothetical protein
MDERNRAESEIAQSRERIGELAEELARRASPPYLRERAREKVMMKTSEWKSRAVESPRLYQLLGAAVGWALGRTVFSVRDRRISEGRYTLQDRSFDSGIGYTDESLVGSDVDLSGDSGIRAKAREAKESLSDKAQEMLGSVKERAGSAREKASGLLSSAREHVPSASEARERMSGMYHHTVDDQPALAVIGALALGTLAAFLIPVTDKERQVLTPAKERVKEQLTKVSEAVEAKVAPSSESSSDSSMSSLESSQAFSGEEDSARGLAYNSDSSTPTGSNAGTSDSISGPHLPSVH